MGSTTQPLKRIFLPKNQPRERVFDRLNRYLGSLSPESAYKIEIKEVKGTRTLAQNAYLWGVCYPEILKQGGETLAGWTANDLHEYFLGEHFGWETIEGFGRKRMKPLHRSSRLSTMEFVDYVDFIQRTAAGLGIVIPDPEPYE